MTPGIIDQPRRRRRRGLLRSARHLALCESGMISVVNALAVAFCVLLIVMILNIGHLVHQKIEMQNAADAVAYSSGVWHARGMNAITATNHVIGELTALVAIHEAIGGQRLEAPAPAPANTKHADAELDAAYALATATGATTPAYPTVRQRNGVFAGRTIRDSKITLKEWLTWIYRNKTLARQLQQSANPVFVAAGLALEAAMNTFEPVILQEYLVLKELHHVAVQLLPLKQIVRDEILPEAKRYTTYVRDETPSVAAKTATMIAGKNSARGALFPRRQALPLTPDPLGLQIMTGPNTIVEDDPIDVASPAGMASANSQLTRATWPWVNYHRKPMLNVLEALVPFSAAARHYLKHSANATLYLCHDLQRSKQHDLGLYVVTGYDAPHKGHARWTADPVLADKLFTLVGLAHRGPPLVIGAPAVFRQEHAAGRIALAQAMLYNANRQEAADPRHPTGGPVRQADVGWDTLNWREGMPPFEFASGDLPWEYPQIKVNWQVKLVPLSANRLSGVQRSRDLPRSFQDVAKKLLPVVPQSLRTH